MADGDAVFLQKPNPALSGVRRKQTQFRKGTVAAIPAIVVAMPVVDVPLPIAGVPVDVDDGAAPSYPKPSVSPRFESSTPLYLVRDLKSPPAPNTNCSSFS